MAQGTFKSKKPAVGGKKQTPLGLRKGSKVIPAKNKKLAAQQKATKKLSSGLAAKTERMLAERAGHLEMLAGGKKSASSKTGDARKAKK